MPLSGGPRPQKSPAEAAEKRTKFLGVSRFVQRKTHGRGRKTPARAMRVILATLPAPLVRVAYYANFAPSLLSLKVRLTGLFLCAPGASILKANTALVNHRDDVSRDKRYHRARLD